jgi:ABC-type multidrug transport system fused ATPase/permease subunit
MKKSCYPFALTAIAVLGAIQSVDSFQPIRPAGTSTALLPTNNLVDRKSSLVPKSTLFGKKKKGGAGGGGKPRGQQQQQEKQSVKDARFDAATRQFMFTLVGLTKMLPDKSKKILDNIHLSFYPGAKIGIVGLNGSGKVGAATVENISFFPNSSDSQFYIFSPHS